LSSSCGQSSSLSPSALLWSEQVTSDESWSDSSASLFCDKVRRGAGVDACPDWCGCVKLMLGVWGMVVDGLVHLLLVSADGGGEHTAFALCAVAGYSEHMFHTGMPMKEGNAIEGEMGGRIGACLRQSKAPPHEKVTGRQNSAHLQYSFETKRSDSYVAHEQVCSLILRGGQARSYAMTGWGGVGRRKGEQSQKAPCYMH
jgi:hypothetical protein